MEEVRIPVRSGEIDCRYHHAAEGRFAVLYVFGAGGGLGGPAGGLYIRMAESLAAYAVAGLRLDYRRAGQLQSCVEDVLAGIAFLEQQGRGRVALVGHSFGGAAVITAGAKSPAVCAVAALSSQRTGTGAVSRLSPRPLLLIHGGADEVLPAFCSEDINERANEPKQLLIYPGCLHGLDQCRERLDADLLHWLRNVTGARAPLPPV